MSGDRIAELEARVERLERARALTSRLDERIELGLRQRQPLERLMPALLEILTDHVGARAAAVRTLDESLSERTFARGDFDLSLDLLESEASTIEREEGVVLVERLDVAGEPFGAAYLFFDGAAPEDAAELLHLFGEELDDHLAAIARARRHFDVIRSISEALREPVLVRGIERAVQILRREVGFARLVLMFRHEESLDPGTLRYRIYEGGELVAASDGPHDAELDAFLREHASAFFDGDDAAVRERLSITRFREELLITGVRSARVVGRMLVTSAQGEFHTHDRELLDRFADYLRQRIVDFNREWRQLSNIFDAQTCGRLLTEEGYTERWLTRRDREVAILFCDIAGFTKISERVLRTPEAIGRLIDTWSERAVAAIWERRGVFDKMVGDCVIGLFGPPFYEDEPRERCARALSAAEAIRALTRRLVDDPLLRPELAALDAPLDVAVGLHYCPVSVGFFGPNHDYTAFSSGMNNTARLQGLARGGEILCMQRFVDELGESERFGPRLEAAVKNVARPLAYRALV